MQLPAICPKCEHTSGHSFPSWKLDDFTVRPTELLVICPECWQDFRIAVFVSEHKLHIHSIRQTARHDVVWSAVWENELSVPIPRTPE